MYLKNRRRLPTSAWLAPLLIALAVLGAIAFDYYEQHRSFLIFGTEIDIHNVRQVLIQPSPDNPDLETSKYYKIADRRQLVSMFKILSKSTVISDTDRLAKQASLLDNIYIQFSDESWDLQLREPSLSNHLYIEYNGKLFRTSAGLLQAISRQS